MAAVEIGIVHPLDGAVVVGTSTVDLVGYVGPLPAELAGVPLYHRWYSSEFRASNDHYSLNEEALPDPTVTYSATLGVGSQALTLAAADQPGQDTAAQNATRHGGVTGGGAGPSRCVVHVLHAVASRPAAGETISKVGTTLEAHGPLYWPEPDYQAMNRLRYRWRFEPAPADARKSGDLTPAATALTPVPSVTTTVLRYTGPLPDLDLGAYTMWLRVEDTQDAAVADSAAVQVVIAP